VSGRFVPPGPLGLGGAPLGNLFAPLPEADAAACLDAAWQGGIRHFDTAPLYGTGLSEHRVGAALRGRAGYVLSTKVGRMLDPDPAAAGTREGYVDGLPFRARFDYSAAAAVRSLEDSRQRLGLARIDIAYIHDPAEDTHGPGWRAVFDAAMEGAARALTRLRERGEIRAWGVGVNRVEPCLLALERADPDLFLLAGRYTLLDTSALERLMPACLARGVRLVLGGPYNSGLLAGGTTFDYAAAPPAMVARARRIGAVCAAHDVDIRAAALQFCAAHPAVAAVIPGARTAAEVRQNIALMHAPIPTALWAALRSEGLVPAAAPVPA
jgi:D-threo-aldose 1-dehydrogenase